MTLGGTYNTGTVSTVSGDETRLVFDGALMSTQAEIGDWIFAKGAIGFVGEVEDDDNLILSLPWEGGDMIDEGYVLIKMSWLRYDPAMTQQKVRDLIGLLEEQGSFLFVAGAAPDPGMGEEGQYALKTNGGPWQLWYKTGGAWVSHGIPVGTTFRGAWDAGTAYFANDQVEHNGSTWGGITASTGVEPGTNIAIWALSAAKGADGKHGGAIAFVQAFSSSTANSDPGAGIFRFNQSSQPSTTIIRVDNSDELGEPLQALLVSIGSASTSAVKGQFRIVEITDPQRWLTFNVTAANDMTGYFNVVGSIVSVSTNPIRNLQRCILFFTAKGDKGDKGDQGNQGYAPLLTITSDGGRRVLKVADWIGGAGTKPPIGKYLGVSDWVDNVADAIDIRGPQGGMGLTGPQGQGIQFQDNGTTAGRAIHDGEQKGYVYIATDVVPNMIYIKNSNATADWSAGSPIGGAGDMLKADNLAGLASNASARDNLGLGDLATMDKAELDDPFVTAIIFGG